MRRPEYRTYNLKVIDTLGTYLGLLVDFGGITVHILSSTFLIVLVTKYLVTYILNDLILIPAVQNLHRKSRTRKAGMASHIDSPHHFTGLGSNSQIGTRMLEAKLNLGFLRYGYSLPTYSTYSRHC